MPPAVYPGSLDPITFGHTTAIRDTAESFGKLVVALGVNPAKKYLFSLAERESLARQALANIPGVSVTSFSGLLVHFLVRKNLGIVVRGLRNGRDLDDAMMQEAIGWQQAMAQGIKAFYVGARPGQTFISSTALKQVVQEQGDATHLAPTSSIHATQARLLGQYLYGVTGASGAGKSSICRHFQAIANRRHIPLTHIDLDRIGQTILADEHEPLYEKTRARVKQAFGTEILDEEGNISRKKLGELVFGHQAPLQRLNNILHEPIFFRMNDHLRGKRGVFLVDSALLAETNRTNLTNHHVLLVQAKQPEIHSRLQQRDNLTPEQIARRVSSQYSNAAKANAIRANIQNAHYGHLDTLNNHDSLADAEVEATFDTMLQQIDIFGELRITGFFAGLGLPHPRATYEKLRSFYGTDDRYYHNLGHIVNGLNLLPPLLRQVEEPEAFTLAWLLHDAVHNVHRHDNEESSVALLTELSREWNLSPRLVKEASRLILATSPHHTPQTEDEKLITDLDLAILGSAPNVYDGYERDLRREYYGMSGQEWSHRRAAYLREFKPPYFRTETFREQLADRAEKNIAHQLKRLTS